MLKPEHDRKRLLLDKPALCLRSIFCWHREPTLTSIYSRGVVLRLTNTKAILVWVSIVALSSNGNGPAHGALVAGCAAIGCLAFGSYAVLFSTDSARRMHTRTRRALEGCLAVVFAIAGIRLLASRL
ncbi:hypothetical protein DIE06_22045 [Burkholderia sp. Bp8998]|nr:hypothetical protein DIE06_22045 [Burkholderia sp. Bp8998]